MIRYSLLLSALTVGFTLTLGLSQASALDDQCPECSVRYQDPETDASSELEPLILSLIPD